MKNRYISPSIKEQHIQNLSILCASGGRTTKSNVDIHGEGKSGNAADAF